MITVYLFMIIIMITYTGFQFCFITLISKWLRANKLVSNVKNIYIYIVKFTPTKIDTCRSNSYQSR